MLATSITVGSGNSGGIFAPSLFMGVMLGQCYGIMVNYLFPGQVAPAGVYALVGMAAFLSGAVRAPITSILIIFEMTGNYNLVLPLMLTTVSSSLFSKWISKNTIYTEKLARQGIDFKTYTP
jgi:CIC family chloride channel protein